MKRLLVFSVALALLGGLVPLVESQGSQIVPEPMPLSPETGTFHILGMLSAMTQEESGCPLAVSGSGKLLYAINNLADPCQVPEDEVSDTRHSVSMDLSTARFRVPILPAMAAGTPLVEGENINVKFTLALAGAGNAATATAGFVQPKVSLTSGKTVIGSWDEGGALGADTVHGPEGNTIYLPYEIDLPAPATLPGGVVNLTVDLSNSATEQELRRLSITRVGFAISEDHRGSITFPFAANVADFGQEDEDTDDADDNTTGNETTGNETVDPTSGNNTTASPTPTNTTATNNTTTPTTAEESGFLPGFEVVGVLSAGLIALAYVARERRRPPVNVRR